MTAVPAEPNELTTIGGWAAIAAAVVAISYSVAFVILSSAALYSVALLVGGVLSAVALAAAYERIRAGAAQPGRAGHGAPWVGVELLRSTRA